MKIKYILGSLLVVALIGIAGIVIAHGNSQSKDSVDSMTTMMKEMTGPSVSGMEMKSMMMGIQEEIMNDETSMNEMLEHMENCPMMNRFH